MLEQEILPYIDLESGLKRIRGNKTFYCKMVKLFLNENDNDSFEASLQANDNARAGDIAHGIKGVTGNLSFNVLYEISAKLTVQLRDGIRDEDLIAQYRDAYVKTIEYAKRVVEELQ